MFLRNLALVLLVSILSIACTQDEIAPANNIAVETLIFGTYFGECIGESCIEIFKVESGKVYEDTEDTYPTDSNGSRTFVERSGDAAALFSSISSELLDALMSIKNTQIGCPDCRDQGGVYLEIVDQDNVTAYWAFDRDKSEVPLEYHDLIDAIVDAVDLLK